MSIRIILFGLFIALSVSANAQFSSIANAKEHSLIHDGPAPDFFEGALIGNGGLGAVVCTRPDAIAIRFAHNNVWDIRIAENNKEKLGNFQEIFEKVKNIDSNLESLKEDSWYSEYINMARENYAKPYPRPFPCGSLLFGFDRRKVEVIGHKLDISTGLVTIQLLLNQKSTAYLKLFADIQNDRVWMKLVDETGNLLPNCFNRVRLIPDSTTPKEFPKYESFQNGRNISFRQVLPYLEPDQYDLKHGHPKDKSFVLSMVTSSDIKQVEKTIKYGKKVMMDDLEYGFTDKKPFWATVSLSEGLAKDLKLDGNMMSFKEADLDKSLQLNTISWENYWSKSGISTEDDFLEETWYRCLYFFNCATKSGVNCPGLFANWSYNNIGTAWHGDYHMNYNTQQPFWMTFSSNHLEKNLPYVEMIEFITDVSKKWAQEYYGMRGAYYPHSAYPVDMTMNPYPVPTWGWEVFETPWAVQGVWWHYLYSGDKEFLRSRAFPLIKEAVLFMVDYMMRPAAHGSQWNDNKYHIFPTVPPELYGLQPGFKFNNDGLVDLTLTKFLFNSYLKSVDILGAKKEEKGLIKSVKDIMAHYPEYPTGISEEYGEVFVSVEGENTEIVYNAPISLFTVFPGEEHGLHSDNSTMEILANSERNHRNEGGNELVFLNLQAARIGMLDLEAFKREIKYNQVLNGTFSNNTLQGHGRYNDNTNTYFMRNMGVWFENLGLPAVINECMLQSYNGTIRLFPNWPENKEAEFKTLRAVGGFLVSSSISEGIIQKITIKSEHDNTMNMYNPWGTEVKISIISDGEVSKELEGDDISIAMKKGQVITMEKI